MKKILTLFAKDHRYMLRVVAGLVLALLITGCGGDTAELDGGQEFQGTIAKSYEDSVEWWPEPTQPPEGAPNNIIFLLDDVGFALSDAPVRFKSGRRMSSWE